jgi:hypothetical protein
MHPLDKLRLIMCYVATHPERLDQVRRASMAPAFSPLPSSEPEPCDCILLPQARRIEWMRAAGLSDAEFDAVLNLAYLGVKVLKQRGCGDQAEPLLLGNPQSYLAYVMPLPFSPPL